MFDHDTTTRIAAGALLLLIAAGIACLVRFMRRVHYSPMQVALFVLNEFMSHFVWRATVEGWLPVAANEGAVIVSNHRSSFDPCFIAMITNYRKVHWMVAGEFFESKVMGPCLRALEAVPVGRRGIDTAATKRTIRYAENGELVGMFPEGRINTTDALLLPGRPGAVLVALEARVPIIPCYIEGSPQAESVLANFFLPARVRVKIGQPIDLAEWADCERDAALLQLLTREVMRQIASLAGQSDFEPKLAGRNWHPDHVDQ
jgi:1-acyl-sn-glycerol-3-phosphate acyltransferase